MSIEDAFANLVRQVPDTLRLRLRGPANAGAIKIANSRLEKRANSSLSEEFETLWQMHDGQNGGDDLFPGFSYLPLAEAISNYDELCGLAQEQAGREFDAYAPPKEFWEKWFDPILFPIGWTPGGSGCLLLAHTQAGTIWRFNPDGGLGACLFESVRELINQSIAVHSS